MKSNLTRREFLKSAGAISIIPLLNRINANKLAGNSLSSEQPNIIFILFDALSAFHLSLYGYQRETSPNLERFARRSIVYHNHHSASNHTIHSTSSLLTGTYPWTHRTLSSKSPYLEETKRNNIFNLLGDKFFQTAFTQNINADKILYKLDRYLDQHAQHDSFSLIGNSLYDTFSGETALNALSGLDNFLFDRDVVHGSLFLSILNDLNTRIGLKNNSKELKGMYPYGIPKLAMSNVYFLLSEVTDGVADMLGKLNSPHFSYIHFMPPHAGYQPTSEFMDMFDDGWAPAPKDKHPLGKKIKDKQLNKLRHRYDAFVSNVDYEFGRLIDQLEISGLLENSYVIFTSDHGELFERGTRGHVTKLLFEPLIHIPLLISSPGQRERVDIHELTSNVDILPTLAHISNIQKPDWAVGEILPGLGGAHNPDRNVWSLIGWFMGGGQQSEIERVSLALNKGEYKLVKYHGYGSAKNRYEFYDLRNDPEELDNQYKSNPIAKEMRAELDQKFEEIKSPIEKLV